MQTNKANSLWLAIQYGLAIIFSLVTLKLNLEHFGKELFGYWILVASLWGFGKALDFGLGTSLIKFVAEYNHKDPLYLKPLLSSCFYLFTILGLLILAIIYGIAQVIYFGSPHIISADYNELIWNVFILLGLSFYINYITIFFRSSFEGMNDFVMTSKINIANSIFILSSVCITSYFSLSLIALAFLLLASSVLTSTIYFIIFTNKFSHALFTWKYIELSIVKKVFSFSLSIQGAVLLGSLIDPIIKYLLGSLNNIGSVSIYEIARRFVTAITGLYDTTFRTILPKASVLFSKDAYKSFIYNECVKLSKVGIFYSGIFFGAGTIVITFIIKLVFGYDEAVLLYLVLAIPESINKFGYSIYNFFVGTGRAHFLIFIQFINVVVIGLSVFLGLIIFKNSLGLLGYGFSVLGVNFVMMWLVRKVASVSVIKYFVLSGAYKSILLLLLLLLAIFSIYFQYLNITFTVIILSGLSLMLFISDVKEYSRIIVQNYFQ
ncbi:MAG: oligosaccharide flippase family protein [Ignavibacteria bacterium]|nr:oligosaccharide flippase family protein [Ignavibacteria bacterium]